MPTPWQISAASNIFSIFLSLSIRFAILNAYCQSGKTGTFQELIRLMLENGIVNKVYILCGSNETVLRDQAHDDTKNANPTAYGDGVNGVIKVFFRQDFNNTTMDIANSLIIVDESHLDQTQGQQLDGFLGKHGLSMDGNPKTLNQKNVFIVSVDATPYTEMSALIHKESYHKHLENLTPGDAYFGLSDYFYKRLIRPTFDITSNILEFENIVKNGKNKYSIMRFQNNKKASIQENMATTIYNRIGGKVYYFISEKNDITIDTFNTAPLVPTLVIIRGRLRAGKVVPKKYISFVWEGAETSNTDSIVQGLAGRMCGYPFSDTNPYGYGEEKPYIFLPPKSLKRNEGKVIESSEIERAIMGIPLMLPRVGMNLMKGHIATAASNGKTQCPPLRLTWPLPDDDEWIPEMNGEITGELCREFLLKHEDIIHSAPFSKEQKEEIASFISIATPHKRTLEKIHSSGPHKGKPISDTFKKYFSAVIEAYEAKTAVAENVSDCPQMTFFITKDAIVPHANKRYVYVIFYTDATTGASPSVMAVDLKSRIPVTNNKSGFSKHDPDVVAITAAQGSHGIKEEMIKTPILLEKALRVILTRWKDDEFIVTSRFIENEDGERFKLSKKSFHYVSKDNNDVKRICTELSSEFNVKMKASFLRSGDYHFNVKKIEW